MQYLIFFRTGTAAMSMTTAPWHFTDNPSKRPQTIFANQQQLQLHQRWVSRPVALSVAARYAIATMSVNRLSYVLGPYLEEQGKVIFFSQSLIMSRSQYLVCNAATTRVAFHIRCGHRER